MRAGLFALGMVLIALGGVLMIGAILAFSYYRTETIMVNNGVDSMPQSIIIYPYRNEGIVAVVLGGIFVIVGALLRDSLRQWNKEKKEFKLYDSFKDFTFTQQQKTN